MNPTNPTYHVAAADGREGLTCRFLVSPPFTIADLPPATPDFSDATQFMPLAIAIAPQGPMVVTVAVRPAFEEGAVAQWLEYLCRQAGYPHSEITPEALGVLPAVRCDATQQADDGTAMRMRLVLLEDGGRLFQLSAMAPEMFWSAALNQMQPMLASFELREVRGTKFALLPGTPTPAPAAPPPPVEPPPPAPVPETAPQSAPEPDATPQEPRATLTTAELIALALAEDTASLDQDHPLNRNMLDRGVGFVPRVMSSDTATRSVRLAAGAVQGIFRVPFGWHAIDDGKRTLVFDAGGRIQVNLSQRLHEGASTTEYARQLLRQYLEEQPDLPTIENTLCGIAGAGVRGVRIGNEILDQFFLIRDVGRPGLYLVARVSAAAEDLTRALDLAGDIVATFDGPSA